MQHLDEGTLHALLDGEIPSGELAPIQAHLDGCAECRDRLAEERAFMEESDQLVGALEVPPQRSGAAPIGKPRRTWLRPLAFAATVVLALGIGYSAGSWRTSSRDLMAAPAVDSVPPAASSEPQARADAPAESSARAEPSAAPAPSEQAVTRKDETPRRRAADALARKAERESAPAPEQRRASAPVAQSLSDAANTVAGRAATVDSVSKPAAPPVPTVATAPPPAAGARTPEPLRLEERIATGTTAGALGLSAKLAAAPQPAVLTLPEAVRALNGTMLLVRGLVPDRLERLGTTVRVVYATSFGELVLSQELVDGKVAFNLIAPRGFPADSLVKLRDRVRE